MNRQVIIILSILIMLMAACSQKQQHIASVYIEPEEVKACDDSIEIHAAALDKTADPFEEYRGVYKHFLRLYPNSTELHRDYQRILEGFDHTEEMIEIYQKYYDDNPNSPMYCYLLGRAKSGEESAKLFKKTIELDPNYFWGYFGYAASLLSMETSDTARAIKQYWRCAEIDNSYPNVYRQLTNLYLAQEKYDDALSAVELYKATFPGAYRPAAMKWNIHIKRGDLASAEQEIVSYVTENKDELRSRGDLVDLYLSTECYADALTYQYQIAELERDPADAIFKLARIHAQASHPDSALDYLDKVIALGFADYRRLSRAPELETVRSLEGYAPLHQEVKSKAKQAREAQMEARKEGAEERQKQVLAEKLDVPAPDFSLVNLEGQTISLANLRGKVVVLDFWATWCGPCRMTMPLLQEFVDFKKDDIEVFSVNIWESDTSNVRPYLTKYCYDLNVLFANAHLGEQYEVTGIPTLFVIDKEGTIRYRHIGYSNNADEKLIWQTEDLL